ncbi:MAG: tetratricopeptide repeat protein [Acidobacteria bacterium]|nr:tetratricopeptide repeat protein [Acidobacteriota bacterium]
MAQSSLFLEFQDAGSFVGKEYGAGLSALKAGDYAAAFQAFAKCLKVPVSNDILERGERLFCASGGAYIHMLRGEFDQTARIYRSLNQSVTPMFRPSSCAFAAERAAFLREVGQGKEAEKSLSDALRHRTSLPEWPLSCRNGLTVLADLQMDTDIRRASDTLRTSDKAWRDYPLDEKGMGALLVRGRLARVASRLNRLNGQLEEAEKHARSAVELHLQVFAAETWDVAADQIELADVLSALGKRQEAANLYMTAYKTLISRLGPAQPLAKVALRNLAANLRAAGQAEDAAKFEAAAVELPVIPCRECAPAARR